MAGRCRTCRGARPRHGCRGVAVFDGRPAGGVTPPAVLDSPRARGRAPPPPAPPPPPRRPGPPQAAPARAPPAAARGPPRVGALAPPARGARAADAAVDRRGRPLLDLVARARASRRARPVRRREHPDGVPDDAAAELLLVLRRADAPP